MLTAIGNYGFACAVTIWTLWSKQQDLKMFTEKTDNMTRAVNELTAALKGMKMQEGTGYET